jgi:hypothetical protein
MADALLSHNNPSCRATAIILLTTWLCDLSKLKDKGDLRTMRYRVTIVATLIGVALCLYNFTGYDPHNMVFFMFSVPGWFADLFMDIHDLNVILMYILTIASWALLGFFCDLLIHKGRRKEGTRG